MCQHGDMRNFRLFFCLCAAFTAGILFSQSQVGVQAESAWKFLFNGKESKTAILDTDAGKMVPVYFSVPKEGRKQTYGVLIETDPVTMQIRVNKVKKKRKVRDAGDCPTCAGSKECQECYPVGSKVGTNGSECYPCNGSGDCSVCEGDGDCYTCDREGFEQGCPTCGMVKAVSGNLP